MNYPFSGKGGNRWKNSLRPDDPCDVEYIVAATLIDSAEALERVFKFYRDAVWACIKEDGAKGHLDLKGGDFLARWFWKEGRIRQPRLAAGKANALVPDCYICPLFVKTEADIIWMEVDEFNHIIRTGIRL
jgi:hypothetical protein